MTTPTGDDEIFEVYERTVFSVRAARVTEENIHALALQCEGSEIKWTAPRSAPAGDDGRRPYIQLPIVLNATRRQLQGFVGDVIVDFEGTYKVFGHRVFSKNYHKPEDVEINLEGEGPEGGVVSVPAHNCCLHLHLPHHQGYTIPFNTPKHFPHTRPGNTHRLAS